MFTSTYSLVKGNEFFSMGYVMIEEQPVPEMYPEFAPGPEDEMEAMFWNTSVHVYWISFDVSMDDSYKRTPKITEVGWRWMKLNYKFIHGRTERIHYWQVMKHLERMDATVGDGLPW